MNDLDREIEKALSAEDRALAKQFEELGLINQFKTVFQGSTAFVSIASLIVGTILSGVFFYAMWQFFMVTEMADKLIWGGTVLFVTIMTGFIKIWFFIRMESNRLVREIKRLELQIARSSK